MLSIFGGQNATARAIGRRQSTVWRWASTGIVPIKHIPEIIAAAARLDPPVHLTPNDFFDVPAVGSVSVPTAAQASP